MDLSEQCLNALSCDVRGEKKLQEICWACLYLLFFLNMLHFLRYFLFRGIRRWSVSHSRTRDCLSPLSHLGSPEVELREERGLKARSDEKRGCQSIVARLAHPLMELYRGRAPRGSTPPWGHVQAQDKLL